MSDETRTADELYQSAISSRNLGVDLDRRGDADAIMAGAWSDSAAGKHLLRLQAEWESGQKPLKPTPQAVAALVESMNRAGAKYTAEQAIETTVSWYCNELNLFFLKLRSRHETLDHLTAWAERKRIDRALVAPVLYWWLAPKCIACGGHGRMKAPGAPMLSAQTCKSCKGSGEKPIPHGHAGRQLASGFDDLANVARASMHRKLKKSG